MTEKMDSKWLSLATVSILGQAPEMYSLQNRLGIWLIGSVLLLFGLHWFVTSRAPRILTEEYVTTRLVHDAESLLVGLDMDTEGHMVLDPSYVAPVYQRPYSGHYFVVIKGDQRIRSRSLWDEDLKIHPEFSTEIPAVWHGSGPQDQPLLIWSRIFRLMGYDVVIAVAEDLTSMEEHIAHFRLRFTIVTLVMLIFLIAAQRFILNMSLRPLDRLRRDCQCLERGEACELSESVPLEVRPLVTEINRLLGIMQQRLERSRKALGNLTHSIKTPLTLLSQLSAKHVSSLPAQDARDISDAVRSIQDIVSRELKRARVAGTASPGQSFNAGQEFLELLDVIKKIYADKNIHFKLNVQQGTRFPGDREDMLELFGNLLDNAAKWARTRVSINVEDKPGLTVSVEDDGPGIEDNALAFITGRGVRLDEASPGHGLGLSISKEIVENYGGVIEFSRSPELGGLLVRVSLPH